MRPITMPRLHGLAMLLAATGAVAVYAEDRALLIGIERYADSRIPALPGCEDDAREMALLLKQGFEMREGQIRLLLSRDATLKNILDALETWVVGGTQPGDRVVLYFSGHGSRAPDDRGDGVRGLRPILCPYDYQASTQANMLRGRVLREYLTKLVGRNITIVFDACHCGTAYKSIEGQVYSDPLYPTTNTIPKFVPPPPEALPALRDRDESIQVRSLPSPISGSMIEELTRNEVVFSACEDEQRAEIGVFIENGRLLRRSVFTRAFLKGMTGQADRDADRKVTNAELFTFIRGNMREFTQTPQLKCDSLYASQLVFGRTLTLAGPPRLFYTKDHEVAINRGEYHGVQKNDRFLLTTAVANGVETVDIKLDRVESFLSFGRVDKDIRFVPPGPEVQPMVRPRPFQKLQVFFGAFTDSSGSAVEVPASLRQAVAAVPELRMEADQAACHRIVAGTVASDGTLNLFVYGRFGRLQSQFSEPQATAPAELIKRLKGQILLEKLAAVDNPLSSFRMELRIKGDRNRFIIQPKGDPRRESVEFLVTAGRDCHLVLLDVDSQGQVTLLMPNRWQASSRLAGGREYQVPPVDAAFVFPIQMPPGHDVIKAIATTKPFDLRSVTAKGLQEQGFIHIEPGEEHHLVEDILARGIGLDAVPGSEGVPTDQFLNEIPSADWVTATLTIETILPQSRP